MTLGFDTALLLSTQSSSAEVPNPVLLLGIIYDWAERKRYDSPKIANLQAIFVVIILNFILSMLHLSPTTIYRFFFSTPSVRWVTGPPFSIQQ